MPNRILRDWTDSEAVNELTVFAERFFVRLIMKADDFGRQTANPRLLRPLLFPLLLDQVREADLQRWLAECEKAGLIRLYEAGGKRVLQIQRFQQRTRAEKSKFPDPNNDGHLTVTRPSLAHGDVDVGADGDGNTSCAVAQGFERFWSAWPRHFRKLGKSQCRKFWKTHKLEPLADQIVTCLQRFKTSPQWTKEDGQFIPLPRSWLGKTPWETDPGDLVSCPVDPLGECHTVEEGAKLLREEGV